jgi:ATP-dependent Clp protease ATP-binding subunit ClpA
MGSPSEWWGDIFTPDGRLRSELLTDSAAQVLEESKRLACATHWDRLRSPHVFMGLLALPDDSVRQWGERIGADLPKLKEQFQELFHQDRNDENPIHLNREYLSDNVIHLLREAQNRASDLGRSQITSMDLLVCILTAPKSFVAGCFEHVGFTAAKLTEWAVIAEHQAGQP